MLKVVEHFLGGVRGEGVTHVIKCLGRLDSHQLMTIHFLMKYSPDFN